mmetsp:Transcript_19379/g.14049  ORF Transcript_19379/g.14049 Transcript_19379/m.14049 type:complete len:93 (+) Transcript_19379:826-1104(+)
MFKNAEFFKLVLKEGYSTETFGQAVAHFCYEDLEYTKWVSKRLVLGVAKNDYEKVKHYLDLVTAVCQVKDSMQALRLEMIFGSVTHSMRAKF